MKQSEPSKNVKNSDPLAQTQDQEIISPKTSSAPQEEMLSFFLLDDASSQITPFALELETQKRIAADKTQALETRLEAYEDIFESEVGDTAFAQVRDAVRRGFDAITLATCGNYGVAMAFASCLAGLRCIIHIPETYHTKRSQEMSDYGAEIIRNEGDYEKSVMLSREYAESNEVYDANPGGANTVLQLRAYGEIAYEIYDELRDAPSFVAVPVSNGTTLAGIYRGFTSLYRCGKTSKIPRMIAGSSFGKNPINSAFLKKIPECADLKPEQIRETSVNEPLINWQSLDGDHALESIRLSRGWGAYASDKNMMNFSRLIREREGLNVLPASTAGLIALLDLHTKENLGNDRYVVILTGRK